MLRFQGGSLQKFVAEAIVEGAVKAGGTAVRMQHSETFNLVVPVDQQLRFVAINADQDHILHDCAHIAAKQLVGYSISEKLQRGTTSPTVNCGAMDMTLSTSFYISCIILTPDLCLKTTH